MSNHSDGVDDGFDQWVEAELRGVMGRHLAVPAPAAARFRSFAPREGRRMSLKRMSPIRMGVAVGAAALALGGGTALGASLTASHRTTVSNAAASCATTPAGSHGACVSTVAQTSTTSGSTNSAGPNAAGSSHGAAVASAAAACPTGPGDAHGDCVSAVAKANHGQSVAGGAPGSAGSQGSANSAQGLATAAAHRP
ncbi:MAG TPA: hypothetical protein VIN65_05130 [Candidatus Dormibacteraeota bacterium]